MGLDGAIMMTYAIFTMKHLSESKSTGQLPAFGTRAGWPWQAENPY
jgi:hypothetical protein